MDLDKLWQWERRKLPCHVRQESGNPSGDDLRERFAELAGVNLQDLLADMKTDRKKKESQTSEKVYFDHEGDKRFKDMNSRAHVIGASSIAISKLIEAEKRDLSSTRNTNKRFMALPLAPPARVLMDIQRERAKPLALPLSEERNEATVKLEKKLAKQRAQRMAAKEQTDKDADPNKADLSKSKSDGSMTKVLPKYDGDMFGTGKLQPHHVSCVCAVFCACICMLPQYIVLHHKYKYVRLVSEMNINMIRGRVHGRIALSLTHAAQEQAWAYNWPQFAQHAERQQRQLQ